MAFEPIIAANYRQGHF